MPVLAQPLEYWIGGADSPSVPAMTFTDAADGTGGTAAITGTADDAINTVWTQAVDDLLGTATWTNSGVRQTDGNVVLSLSKGHYWAYVQSNDGGILANSDLLFITVTDGADGLHFQILEAVQARIITIGLAGVANASVVVKKLDAQRVYRNIDGIALPAVIITPRRPVSPQFSGTNVEDDNTYPVQVSVIDDDTMDPSFKSSPAQERHLKHLEQIARAFMNQPLTGVASVYTCAADYTDPILPAQWMANKMVGVVILRFTARQTRGLT